MSLDGASSPDAQQLSELLDELRNRVAERRRQGSYPPELERDLADHFSNIVAEQGASRDLVMAELEVAIGEIRGFHYARRSLADSRIPGGETVHRGVARLVGRHIDDVLEQLREQTALVADALALVNRIEGQAVQDETITMREQLDALAHRVNEQQRQVNRLTDRIDDIAGRIPGVPVQPWYSHDAFTHAFRGDVTDAGSRYADLAEVFVGCDPVLDLGFGRGEFLEMLGALGVAAMGVELDPALVDDARARGLRVDTGRAVEYLAEQADGSLGGLVMLQVIEHLPPQQVIDVVRIAADKVRPGGKVVIETVNPESLYVYGHALWADPDHVRPIHPAFLRFLFAEAGFRSVERVDRSPVTPQEQLERLPGEDDLTKRLNENFQRVNEILFGHQDYALVAVR